MNSAEKDAIEQLETEIEVYFALVVGEPLVLEKVGTLIQRINEVARAIRDISE